MLEIQRLYCMSPIYENLKIEKLKQSEIEISAEVSWKALAQKRADAIREIQKDFEVPGFRKGNVPEEMLVKNVGELNILQEAAEMILSEVYPAILDENKIFAIGKPAVSITKLAPENPMAFKIKTAVLPEFELPDYKTIARDVNSEKAENIDPTETEISQTIKNLRLSLYRQTNPDDQSKDVPDEKLPELNDENIKKFGDHKTIDDFKKSVTEEIKKDKEARFKDKKRSKIIDGILKLTTFDVPNVLIESELNKMEAQFKDTISQFGMKIEDYFSHVKKNIDQMRDEWKPDAEKRAKTQLIMNRIASVEKISPDKDEVEHEAQHVLSHYKDARPENVRIYIETVLTNEKVFNFLELIK